ncbi:MAG TPA: hypothetical protein VK524_12480 [Polyangiaceae bacterium]|nr:hypothetical protein [Polyangiaceae bacterium]
MGLRCLAALFLCAVAGCAGGQSGQPTSGGHGDCVSEPLDPDEAAVEGSSVRQLLGKFMGTHRAPVIWLATSAYDDCPRPREGSTEIEVTLNDDARAERRTCGGPEHAITRLSLGVAGRLRTADARIDETFRAWLTTSPEIGGAYLNAGGNRPVGFSSVSFREMTNGIGINGWIAKGKASGAFPTSCLDVCLDEPELGALELPVALDDALSMLRQSSFVAELDGRSVPLGLDSSSRIDRACLRPESVWPAPTTPLYTLPAVTHLKAHEEEDSSESRYAAVQVHRTVDCSACTAITVSSLFELSRPTPFWPADAYAGNDTLTARVEVQLRVSANGAISGGGSMLVRYQSISGDGERNTPLTLTPP